MQFITISGRLGGDAETRNAGDGTVTSFNVAVDQGYGDRKTSNWFRVSVWGKKGAGAAPYMLKGGVVTVVGELEIGEYNGKPQHNVRATDFTLPAKASGDRQEPRGNGGNSSRGSFDNDRRGGFGDPVGDDLNDDVPFASNDPALERRAS